jgi:peroxiredoxin
VVYAEDGDHSWERAFAVKGAPRPLTLIAGPTREVLWRHEGEVDSRTLGHALQKNLVATGPAKLNLTRSRVRIGESPPNFLFQHAKGADVTLRKLMGRPVTIVFWNSASKPSIEAVRELSRPSPYAASKRPVILAVNDGEPSEAANRAAEENKLTATVVPDPQQQISRAYGVNVWPTIISLDANGLISGIRYGGTTGDLSEPASAQQSANSAR